MASTISPLVHQARDVVLDALKQVEVIFLAESQANTQKTLLAEQENQSLKNESRSLKKDLENALLELQKSKTKATKTEQKLNEAETIIQDLVLTAAKSKVELELALKNQTLAAKLLGLALKKQILAAKSKMELELALKKQILESSDTLKALQLEIQLTNTPENLVRMENDVNQARMKIEEMTVKLALNRGFMSPIIAHSEMVDTVQTQQSVLQKREASLRQSQAKKDTSDASMDILSTLFELEQPGKFRCRSNGCSFTCAKVLGLFIHLGRRHFYRFSTLHSDVRNGIQEVYHQSRLNANLEGKRFPEWPVYRDWAEGELKFLWDTVLKIGRLVNSQIHSVKKFRNNFLKVAPEETAFNCHHFCPGEVIHTVKQFLRHFEQFHPNELELLDEDVIDYLRQGPLQTTLIADCEYNGMKVNKVAEEKNGEASNLISCSSGKEVKSIELTKTSATVAALTRVTKDLLLENKLLETSLDAARIDLKKKSEDLEASDSKIKRMTPCYDVGAAICSRKLQKQLPSSKQQEDIVERGDSMAHHGTVVPDCTLFFYEKDNEQLKPSEEGFISLYGLPPNIIRNLVLCDKFIEMVNWRGSMKAFKGKIYEKTAFSLRYLACEARIKKVYNTTVQSPSTMSVNIVTKLREPVDDEMRTESFVADLKFLEKEHEAAKKENQAYHRSRQRS